MPSLCLENRLRGIIARDIIHKPVRNALVKEDWTITADEFIIKYEDVEVKTDLAAERTLAAERAGKKIAVEVKSFVGRSAIHDFELALGQYNVYRSFLEEIEPDRKLFLAISTEVYETIFRLKGIQLLVRKYKVALIIVDIAAEEIVRWET